ncbi:uncharacterized protein OCT59_008711 [Rhizophagus irregularis]|uniref:uncharacterized protein n=1 Tax=Rhizophagus irregularis TaxID=588596 RepID=UPI003329444B|nr:hypothetical protein OCT59_008711 [Rhizophagus irregularis]
MTLWKMQVRLIVNINDFNNAGDFKPSTFSTVFQSSSPKQITTPPRKRSPRSRLTTYSYTFEADIATFSCKVGKVRCPKSIIKKEILKLDVIANDWICPATPSKGKKNKFQCDRFIPVRETMGEPSEQLKIPQRESGKEQYLNSNELEYQEKLAEACGVSLEKRILAFNLQPPSSQKDDLHWSIKNMVAIGLDQCVYIWNADTGGVTSLERTNPSD